MFSRDGSGSEALIRELDLKVDHLSKELSDLQEKYTAMVDSRATIFFEKEVRVLLSSVISYFNLCLEPNSSAWDWNSRT